MDFSTFTLSESRGRWDSDANASISTTLSHKKSRLENYYADRQYSNVFSLFLARLRLLLDDLYAAFHIYFRLLFTVEFLAYSINAAGAACFFIYYVDPGTQNYLASKMSFTLLSVSITFPLTFQMNETFSRRGVALGYLADFKALVCNITFGLCIWDFPNAVTKESYGGRSNIKNVEFYHATEAIGIELCKELYQLLVLPTTATGRFLVYKSHVKYEKFIQKRADEHVESICRLLRYVARQVEVLKENGMPANEASRINQYIWILQSRVEVLTQIKRYRTPQSTRSFSRIQIILLPWFSSPYFAWLASREANNPQTNIPFAICLSVFYTAILVGLMVQARLLEDVFLPQGTDNVRMDEDFVDYMRLVRWAVTKKIDDITDNEGKHLFADDDGWCY